MCRIGAQIWFSFQNVAGRTTRTEEGRQGQWWPSANEKIKYISRAVQWSLVCALVVLVHDNMKEEARNWKHTALRKG